MSSILIVDDEKNMLLSLKAILEDEGFEISTANSGEEGLRLLETRSFDMMITDLKMSQMNGLELLEESYRRNCAMPVVLMTAYATPKSAAEAIKSGAFDYIPKPFDPEEIIFSVRKALEYTFLQRENLQLKETLKAQTALQEITGEDPGIVAVRELIQSVAPTKATVLIQGESGTGKELVAKAVHELSDRNKKRFVPVNCAAIPEALLESELFGHEKGAFTGAIYTKKGKFELAAEGTIYLDEVGDMSLVLQAKILRVLEDGQFERVGGTSHISSQARIIAASNKDLKKGIQENTFRDDLYYRLNVINIVVPPLRERASDIPRLVQHFIHRFNITHAKDIQGTTADALKLMMNYSWPGNVRELRNAIERAILLESTNLIQAVTLPLEIQSKNDNSEISIEFNGSINFNLAVENYQKQLIEHALKKNQYRINATAKSLGISRHSLRHYLLKHFKDRRDLNAI